MPAGVRFLKNIQTEVADLIPAGDNDDEGGNKQRGLLFKRSSTVHDDHNVPDNDDDDEYNAKKYGENGDFDDENNDNQQRKQQQQGSFLDNYPSQMYRLQATRGLGDVGCFRVSYDEPLCFIIFVTQYMHPLHY